LSQHRSLKKLFFIEWSWHIFQKFIDSKSKSINHKFYSFDLLVYPYASTLGFLFVCFDDCDSAERFEIGKCESPIFVVLFKDCVDYSRSLAIPYTF
jgi:hypothetical protein